MIYSQKMYQAEKQSEAKQMEIKAVFTVHSE